MAEKVYLKDLFKGQSNIFISCDDMNGDYHSGTGAIDFNNTNKALYAPCKLKLKYYPENTNKGLGMQNLHLTNTLMFESVDNIELANGSVGKLCLGLAHMKDTDYTTLKNMYVTSTQAWDNTLVFEKGDLIYYEGTKMDYYNKTTGEYTVQNCGEHVHIRCGLGTLGAPWGHIIYNGESRPVLNASINNVLSVDDVFYADGLSFSYNSGYSYASNFNWRYSNGSTPSEGLTGIYLVAQNGPFNIRQTAGTGTVKTTVAQGDEAQILEFRPGFIAASDGKSYQWAKVKKGTIEGYAQLDLQGDYLIRRAGGASKVYMKAVNSAFNIRSSKVNGSVLKTVPIGQRADIWNVESSFASDGFQWCQAEYNGSVGYAQMDTVGYYQLEEE